MRTSFWIACAAVVGLGSTAAAQRSTQDGALAATYRALEAPRFPQPRAASLARAERLGLRGVEDALHLLHHPPRESWVRAAGPAPGGRPSLRWPVDDGRFGRGFGYVRSTDRARRHDGVDIVAPRGSIVRAVESGLVAYGGDGIRGFGNCLVIVHPNGWVSVYAHNDRLTVPTGYRVRRGERIAFVGSTGISQGPHLHFELIVGGQAVDPMPHFRGRPWVAARARWEAGELRHRRDHLGVIEPDHSVVDESATGTRTATGTATATATATGTGTGAGAGAATATAIARDATDGEGLRVAVRLLAGGREEGMEAAPGRRFGTLLWPLRGARSEVVGSPAHAELVVRDVAGTPVRAPGDGRVVYVGEGLAGRGLAIVLLLPNGWVTIIAGLGEATVRAGDVVLRGQWVGRLGGAPFRFEVRSGGRPLDPRPLLVHVPEGLALRGATSDSLAAADAP